MMRDSKSFFVGVEDLRQVFYETKALQSVWDYLPSLFSFAVKSKWKIKVIVGRGFGKVPLYVRH